MDNPAEKVLIVSPHCDDACFSLGGSILKNMGENIVIWSVFTEQNYTILPEGEEAAKQRILKEEYSFIKESRVFLIIEGLPDAYLREYKKLSDILLADFKLEELCETERNMFNRVVVGFENILKEVKPRYVGLPIGCGAHIDHLLVREAGMKVWRNSEKSIQIFFYEELPYSLNAKWRDDALCKLIVENRNVTPYFLRIDEFVDKKYNLINLYKSQIKERDSKKIIDYAKTLEPGGAYERIWVLE